MEEMQGAGSVPQENPELWIQLGAETRSTNLAILQTVQELKSEMARLREDNARLTEEQERILRSLSNKQNPPLANPSAEQQRGTEELDYAPEISEEKEDHSDNVLEQQTSKRQKMELQGEFRKIKPPLFDEEQEEAVEAWLININKYFQLYEYDQNLKARLAIFQLQGKATLWWEEIKIVKGVSEQNITWEKFQKYFKEIYLTERFYDEKAREFHDLRLGQQSMDEFINRFTSLLRYVPYIKEEKAKVQRFNKQKGDISSKRWNDKKSNRVAGNNKESRGNGGKSAGKGQFNRNTTKGTFRAKPSESRVSEPPARSEIEGTRPPVQCWRCGGPHYVKNCPQHKAVDQISQIHEASTVGDVARSVPRINVALEDRQAEYQPTMVEFEGKISNLSIAVLIDPGATLSYVSPKVVEHCKLSSERFKNPWLVQLATGAKRRVLGKINNCSLRIAGQPITTDLNVLPLGSYDILIGMDWLEKHWSLVNCKTKTIYYKDDLGQQQEVQGIKHTV
eukprot:PITA_19525